MFKNIAHPNFPDENQFQAEFKPQYLWTICLSNSSKHQSPHWQAGLEETKQKI